MDKKTNKKILISGITGNVGKALLDLISSADEFELADIAFIGEDEKPDIIEVDGKPIRLVRPSERDNYISSLKNVMAVDFTTPSAYVDNCNFFIDNDIPFIIGTTGVTDEDIDKIASKIKTSKISAIIDQNMSVELILVSSALKCLAEKFPNALKDHAGYGFESHQYGKKDDISGTLIKWGNLIKKLGVDFYMAKGDRTSRFGHAYHDLTILNNKGNVRLKLRTEVEGRDTYAQGSLLAIRFLSKMLVKEKGKVYSMTEVLGSC